MSKYVQPEEEDGFNTWIRHMRSKQIKRFYHVRKFHVKAEHYLKVMYFTDIICRCRRHVDAVGVQQNNGVRIFFFLLMYF